MMAVWNWGLGWLWAVLALLLMFMGFVALAASMERHQLDLLGTDKLSAAQVRGWQLSGTLLLALSLWPCFVRWQSVSVSVAAWSGLLTLAGFALGLLFTYSPKGVQRLKTGVMLLAPVVGFVGAMGGILALRKPVQGSEKA